MEHSEHAEEYYAVHISSPNGDTSSGGAVFRSLKEASTFANTPDSKAKGARFKRFRSPDDAKNYAENGDLFYKSSEALAGVPLFGEPTVSFPSVSRTMLNRLKKAIELKDDELFLDMATKNPRYLINVSGDTPTIVVEGFRYNAMHLAAKAGNYFVAKYVLHLVSDQQALVALYGTANEDVAMRSRVLLDCYLNMPDKGSNDTPLHFASKFGHHRIVELLLSYGVCQKNPINKMGFTPAQICCTRYNGDDKEDLRAAMLPLFNAYYVALYRPKDNYYIAIIQLFDQVPPSSLPDVKFGSVLHIPTFETCQLTAYAGPFGSEERAHNFCETWRADEKLIRRTQPRKGAERVGRILANQYRVTWLELWIFSKKLINLQSFTGLNELNQYLVRIKQLFASVPPIPNFACGDNASLPANAFKVADNKNNKNIEVINDSEDTVTSKLSNLHLDTHVTPVHFNSDKDSSIFDKRSIDTEAPLAECSKSSSNIKYTAVQLEPDISDDNFGYYTPPTSPEPVYIYEGCPSKEDEELEIALSLVDPQLIQYFGAIMEYIRQIRSIPEIERSKWPSTDSPRARRCRKRT